MIRTLFVTAIALITAGCNASVDNVALPSGDGAWVLIKGDLLESSGEAIVFVRKHGFETRVETLYSNVPTASFGASTITLTAPCGEVRFVRVLQNLTFSDVHARHKTGATACGFGDRIGYDGWTLLQTSS
jgi:hypothetical protein